MLARERVLGKQLRIVFVL